ncbi:MAG: hypothetical protein Q6353_022325 [Candidatus Sigynarchaeum springense]
MPGELVVQAHDVGDVLLGRDRRQQADDLLGHVGIESQPVDEIQHRGLEHDDYFSAFKPATASARDGFVLGRDLTF